MARRSDHTREELRELALTAAERIVVEQGHTHLSARKVAQTIGYTVGTLYLVFENLDDLILQVNARTLDRLHARMLEVKRKCRDPRACLLRLGEAYIDFATEDPDRWWLIFDHRFDRREVPDWYQDNVARMFELVEELLQAAAARRSRQTVRQAARALWSGVHGICTLALTGRMAVAGVASVHSLVRSLIDNFLKGFVSK